MGIDRNINNYKIVDDITTPLKIGNLVTMLNSTNYSESVHNPRNTVGEVIEIRYQSVNNVYRVRWYLKNGSDTRNSEYYLGVDIIKIKLKYPITYTINKIKFSII